MLRARSTDAVPVQTPGSAGSHPGARPVARWEWRIFARRIPILERARPVTPEEPRRSAETYVLSSQGPHNAKIRDGILEIKHLDRTSHGGLEQWHPALKAPFPLTPDALRAACAALGVPPPATPAGELTQDAFLRFVVAPQPLLRRVEVEKLRTRVAADDCPGEWVSLRVEGDPWESLAFEHEDPALLLDTLRRLELDVKRNTNYPSGLKRILGWPAGSDAPT